MRQTTKKFFPELEKIASENNISVVEIVKAFEAGYDTESNEHKERLSELGLKKTKLIEAIAGICLSHLTENYLYYDKEIGLPAMEKKLENADKTGLNKKLIRTLNIRGEEVKVYTVNRNYVNLHYFQDFTMGGHNLVSEDYNFISDNEIYIDQDLDETGREATIKHESTEFELMKHEAMTYEQAHEIALKAEIPILEQGENKDFDYNEMFKIDWNKAFAEDNEPEQPKVDSELESRRERYLVSSFSKDWAATYDEAVAKTVERYIEGWNAGNKASAKTFKKSTKKVWIGDEMEGTSMSVNRINAKRIERELKNAGIETRESIDDLKKLGLSDIEIKELLDNAEQPKNENMQNTEDFYKQNEDGKYELHFSYEKYKNLSEADKKEIKSYFLFSRNKKAWISKSKDGWRAKQIADRNGIPFQGKDKKLSFQEELEKKKSNAEYRSERYEKKQESAEKRAEALQSEFNRLRKDWSWLTQPIISGHKGSQAFGRSKQRVINNYERGFEEYNKAQYFETKRQLAEDTLKDSNLKNVKFIDNRIKDAETAIRKISKWVGDYQNKLSSLSEDDKIRYEAHIQDGLQRLEYNYDKLSYYKLAKESLISAGKEKGVLIFDRETAKELAKYIKRYFKEAKGLTVHVGTSQSYISATNRTAGTREFPVDIVKDVLYFKYPEYKTEIDEGRDNIGGIQKYGITLPPKEWNAYLKTQGYDFENQSGEIDAEIMEPEVVEVMQPESNESKEPWEMTFEEIAEWNINQFKQRGVDLTQSQIDKYYSDEAKNEYKEKIKYFLSEGKPVPAEILANYPELIEQPFAEEIELTEDMEVPEEAIVEVEEIINETRQKNMEYPSNLSQLKEWLKQNKGQDIYVSNPNLSIVANKRKIGTVQSKDFSTLREDGQESWISFPKAQDISFSENGFIISLGNMRITYNYDKPANYSETVSPSAVDISFKISDEFAQVIAEAKAGKAKKENVEREIKRLQKDMDNYRKLHNTPDADNEKINELVEKKYQQMQELRKVLYFIENPPIEIPSNFIKGAVFDVAILNLDRTPTGRFYENAILSGGMEPELQSLSFSHLKSNTGITINKKDLQKYIDNGWIISKDKTKDQVEADYYLHEGEMLKKEFYKVVESGSKLKADKGRIIDIAGLYFRNYAVKDVSFLAEYVKMCVHLPKGEKAFDKQDEYWAELQNKINQNIWNFIPIEFKSSQKISKVKWLPNFQDAGLKRIVRDFPSRDGLRPAMTTVNFDDSGITATNAMDLIFIKGISEQKGMFCMNDFCMKNTSLNAICKIDSQAIGCGDAVKEAQPSNPQNVYYPAYSQVIPYNNSIAIDFNAYSLLTYAKAIMAVKWYGSAELIIIKMDESYFGFNAEYLKDCLEAMLMLGYEDLTIEASNTNRGVIFNPKGKTDANRLKHDFTLLMLMNLPDGIEKGDVYFDLNAECVTTYGIEDTSCLNPLVVERQEMKAQINEAMTIAKEAKLKAELAEAENERLKQEIEERNNLIAQEENEQAEMALNTEAERLAEIELNEKNKEAKAENIQSYLDKIEVYSEMISECENKKKEVEKKKDAARYLQGNKKGAWGLPTTADGKRSDEISSMVESYKNTCSDIEKYSDKIEVYKDMITDLQ